MKEIQAGWHNETGAGETAGQETWSGHCGAAGEGAGAAGGSGKGNRTVVYDYRVVDVRREEAAQTADCYEALGWQLIERRERLGSGRVEFSLRRGRNLANREALIRLQAKLEDGLANIRVLEARKKRFARGFCWTFGVVGALVLGAGMSLCLLNPTAAMMAVGVAVGVVGLGLCGSNLPIYRALAARGERRIEPLVATRRDEVAALCEEAQKYR